MTIPVPRGRNDLPTIASSTDDLPDDWSPITTMDGKSNWLPRPDCLRAC